MEKVPWCYRVSRYKRTRTRNPSESWTSYRRAHHPVYMSVLHYCRTTRGCIFRTATTYCLSVYLCLSVCLSVYSTVSMFLQLKIFCISLAQSLYFLLSINRWVWQFRSYIYIGPDAMHTLYITYFIWLITY